MPPPSPYPGFIGGSHVAQAPALCHERTVNFYVERLQGRGKTDGALYPAPGFEAFSSQVSGESRGRAIFEENGVLYAVVGGSWVSIDNLGAITTLGAVVEGGAGSPARITSNGDAGGQLFLTSGRKGYVHEIGVPGITEVLSSDAFQCDNLDGFVFVLDDLGSALYVSALNNCTVFPAYKVRDARSDPWRAFKVLDSLVYLAGEKSTDIWYNAGASPFPLAQHSAGAIPYGIAAPASMAIVGNALMWLARSASGIGQVLMVRGSSAQEVSTHPLRVAIEYYREHFTIEDAEGEAFEYLGHQFYLLTFPTAQATWVFDLATGEWVEWLTWLVDEGRYTAWRANWHCVAFGQHLFLDRLGNKVWRIDPASALDITGTALRRLRQAPELFADGARLTIDEFTLLVETGVGPTPAANTDPPPYVTLNYSRDHGKTFPPASGPKSLGRPGEYRTNVTWNRLGTGRGWTPQVVCSENYPLKILGATIKPRPGAG
jgi:hypothetical protein